MGDTHAIEHGPVEKVSFTELRRLGLVSSHGPAPRAEVWDLAHDIADMMQDGAQLVNIDVKAAASRYGPSIAGSGGHRDRAKQYATAIIEYRQAISAVQSQLTFPSALASPPFLVGADDGPSSDQTSPIAEALQQAVECGEADSIEDKLAQLLLDEPPPAQPGSYNGSSSADVPPEQNELICRICLEGAELPSRPLVQPCACRGSSTWTHDDCLAHWRRTSDKDDAAYRCDQCRDDYRDELSLDLLQQKLHMQRAADHPETLTTMNELGNQLHAQGRLGQAVALLHEALQVSRETRGDRHPATLNSINNLGALLKTQGDLDGAAPLLREALQVSRETRGDRHPATLVSINNLGMLLKAQGDLDGAAPLYREALQVSRETLGDRHPDTLVSINNLGVLLKDQGDLDGAAPLYREALQVRRETLGDRHPDTLNSIGNLGELLKDQGETAEVLKLLRELQCALGEQFPQVLLDGIRELEFREPNGGRNAASGGGSSRAGVDWRKGMRVQLEGLKAQPELNGRIGVLLRGVQEDGRAPVKLVVSAGVHTGESIKVKPVNLRAVA